MSDNQSLQINMFGEFSITLGNTTIQEQHSRSGKVWTLLEYLITMRDKEVSQTEIIELLWPEENDSISDPSNTLKTLLHRVRSQLLLLGDGSLRKAVTYRRGSYRWVCDMPCHLDAEDFDTHCKRAAQETDDLKRLKHLTKAINLYKGDFLPRSALDTWVIPITTYYRNQYMKIVYEALDLQAKLGLHDETLAVCQKAVAIDPYDEGIHLILIKTLLATGAQRAALQHYKYVTDLFFTQFGVSPSDALTSLYKEVVKADKNMELDLSIIKESLQELEPKREAFYCEYEFFKDIYRLEARASSRTGHVIHLALITISPMGDEPLSQKKLNTLMDYLREVIGTSLRRNDVISRYSVTQYLLLLHSTSYENGQMILHRIRSAFRARYPKLPVTLQCKLLPLDPLT